MGHTIEWLAGLTSPNSMPYLWWSGFGGCLRDFTALFLALKVHHWHLRRKDDRDHRRR